MCRPLARFYPFPTHASDTLIIPSMTHVDGRMSKEAYYSWKFVDNGKEILWLQNFMSACVHKSAINKQFILSSIGEKL